MPDRRQWLAALLGLCLAVACAAGRDAADTDEARLATAQQMVQAGRTEPALGILRGVAAASRDARVLYEAALLQQLAGDVPAAIASLQRATGLDPAQARVRAQLGTLLALSGRLDEARAQATELIARTPGSPSGPLLFAALARPEDVERAIDALEAVRAARDRASSQAARGASSEAARGASSAAEDPGELELLLALADGYDRAGQRARAEAMGPAIERARLASASDALQLAHVYRQNERRTVSEALLRAAGEVEPSLPVWMPLAAVAIDLGHLDVARHALEQLPQAARKGPEYALLAGSLQLELGQLDQAGALLRQAVALLPPAQQGPGRILLARAYVRGSEPAKAEAELRIVQSAGGLTAEAHLLLADLLRQRGAGPAALRELELLLTEPAVQEEAFGKLVALHTERGELEAARSWCERWLEQHPMHPGAQLGLARLELVQNRTGAAIDRLERILEANPGRVRPLDVLSATLIATGEPDRASQAVERELERAPSAELFDFAAAYFEAHAEPARAEALYRQRIAIDPTARLPLARLAGLLRRQGRVIDALPLYQEALAFGPVDAALALEAAPLEADAGQFAEAITHYEQALSAGARSPDVLNDLAYAYAEHGQRLERALELALEAQRQLPDSLEVADTLGWVHLRRGDHAQALPQLQRAAQGLPKRPNVAYHLGLAELAAGHADVGRRALQRCLGLGPQEELERAARHALASATPRAGRGARSL